MWVRIPYMDGTADKKNATVGRCKDPTIDHVQNHGAKNVPFPAFVGQFFVRKNSSQKNNNLET